MMPQGWNASTPERDLKAVLRKAGYAVLSERVVLVPEGTVPVFLTREEIRAVMHCVDTSIAKATPPDEAAMDKLDAALKESGE